MTRKLVGVLLIILGVVLQIDELERVLIRGATGAVGLLLVAAGIVTTVWGADRRLLAGWSLLVLSPFLVLLGMLMGWPVADSQPGLGAAVPVWLIAAGTAWAGIKMLRRQPGNDQPDTGHSTSV